MKIPHNKPDIILWDHNEKIYQVIESSCPADINILQKVEEKVAAYGLLIRNLQIVYKNHCYKWYQLWLVHSVIFLMSLKKVWKKWNFLKANFLLRKLQNNSVRGMVKICKTFTKFSESWYMVLTVTEYYPADSFLLRLVR